MNWNKYFGQCRRYSTILFTRNYFDILDNVVLRQVRYLRMYESYASFSVRICLTYSRDRRKGTRRLKH